MTVFDPKAGSLQLAFTNGNSYEIPLEKSYHREADFYVDLFWEKKGSISTLSLALHPKASDLILSSCKLKWPLGANFPNEILTQGFNHQSTKIWHSPDKLSPSLGFWEKRALKKLNWYCPLPHPSLVAASYQSIVLRKAKRNLEVKSTDESAALTVFTLAQNEQCLYAENQSHGYHLRHSFPAFELQFEEKKKPKVDPQYSSTFSIASSPQWLKKKDFQKLTQSSLVEEGAIQSFVLKGHENPCIGNSSFDASTFSAFAKTCIDAKVAAGIELSPFVIPASMTAVGIKVDRNTRFKRWSPSLNVFTQPVDLSDEETMRSCEQHLLRFYQLGYRHFILHDVSLSLRDGLKTTTTGQQLTQRLNLIRRVLPNAKVIIGDLCPSEAFKGFDGYKAEEPLPSQLPRLAKFAGIGKVTTNLDPLGSFSLPTRRFAPPLKSRLENKHSTLIDISRLSLNNNGWVALEAVIEDKSYATYRARLD